MRAPGRPRVLYPFVGSQVGGATVSTVEMVRRLVADDRVDPVVVMPVEGPSGPLFRAAGVEPTLHDAAAVRGTRLQASTVGWGGKFRALPTYTAMYRNARVLLRRHHVDVLHLNEDRLVLPWGAAARREQVPVVWHVRQERPSALLDPIRLRLADHLVFVADANRSRFSRMRRLPRTTTLHNVVDLRRFQPTDDVRAAKISAGLDPERLTLTFLGNLFERKRPEWVLAAAGRLQARHPLQVLLVGAPLGPASYVARLREMAATMAEPAHVHFLGGRDDVPALLHASDVVTLPSVIRGEAFPRAIIEAMACGVTVVATDVAGVSEAVRDGMTGRTVHPERFDDYVAALDAVLGAPELRRAMGRSAHEVAADRFGGATMADTLVGLYASLVGPEAP